MSMIKCNNDIHFYNDLHYKSCPFCAIEDQTKNRFPLAAGTALYNYKIIKLLGQGGLGMTYLARDIRENRTVVIKEYFPSHLVMRNDSQQLLSVLSTGKQTEFEQGLRRFKREAITLGEFNHKNIVKVLFYFEANNTAYFAMDYVEGQSLGDYQSSLGRPLTSEEIATHCLPILEGLALVHEKGLLHLDIKPDNILTTTYGEPILIDFGGARYTSAKSSNEYDMVLMVLTPGYAPPEQYSTVAKQTAATDLYAFGMTLYSLMTNQSELPESVDRQLFIIEEGTDPLENIRAIAPGYDEALYQAVEACVALKKSDRPQSVAQLQTMLEIIKTPE